MFLKRGVTFDVRPLFLLDKLVYLSNLLLFQAKENLMPFLTIHTNCKPQNADLFLQDAAQFIASELHKPISYVIVTLDYQPQMIFGGDKDIKSALVEMKSIGFADKKSLAKNLTLFLAQELEAESNFINIHFIDMPVQDLSIGGNLLG